MTNKTKLTNAAQSFTAVGAPSIIMIFVILCLTCFSALSLVSANAEMRLATRLGVNTAAWYEADANGQRRLAQLSELLGEGVMQGAEPEAALAAEQYNYTEEEGALYITFFTKITEYTALKTKVRLTDDGAGFTLVLNETVVTQNLTYTELPFIWDGVTIND